MCINLEMLHILGLLAYGPDDSGLISFNALDHKTYMKYFHRLEAGLAGINSIILSL